MATKAERQEALAAGPLGYVLRNVSKLRAAGGSEFHLLVPRLEIARGEKIGLVGPSGCGKSTLLDLLAMILSPSAMDRFEFAPEAAAATDVGALWRRRQHNQLGELRRRHLGYVLQTGGLLPYLKVRENIGLSRRLLGMPDDGSVEALARTLGIERQLEKLPGNLSVGERQRVAIARALAHEPEVVIADEPTGSLDPVTARSIMSLFLGLAERRGLTVIVASHDEPFVRGLGLRLLEYESRQAGRGRRAVSVFLG